MSPAPLVLLHGWAMRPTVWAPLVRELGTDREISALALPGHDGASPAANPTVHAWSDALLARMPPRAIVVGWSLGAMLALDLAARHPQRVSSLVLIGATPRFVATAGWPCALPAETVSAFVSGYAAAPEPTLRRFLALQAVGDSARRRVLSVLENSREDGTVWRPALADGLTVLADADLRAALGMITQPVQLIHGEGDALMPVDAARAMTGALPNARLDVIEACGHAPFLSSPGACAALVRQLADA